MGLIREPQRLLVKSDSVASRETFLRRLLSQYTRFTCSLANANAKGLDFKIMMYKVMIFELAMSPNL